MLKKRRVWVLVGVAALAAVVLVGLLFYSPPQELIVKEEGLPKGQAVLVKTRAESFGVQKGDAFRYLLRVLYDPAQVSEIDKAALDKNVNWEPFEIRSIHDSQFELDTRTRVYQRTYELQLISGPVNHLYEFPTLVVRYRLKDSAGSAEKAVVPEPIYVASRLPADVANLDLGYGVAYGPLRGVKQEIQDQSQNRVPWMLALVGGGIVAWGVVDLNRRVIRQRKEMAKPSIKSEHQVFCEAYRSLCENAAGAVEPGRVLHQMEHMLTVVLTQKAKVDWLDAPDLGLLPVETRDTALALFEKCQKAARAQVIEQKDVEQAQSQLETILNYYFGEGEIEAWRR